MLHKLKCQTTYNMLTLSSLLFDLLLGFFFYVTGVISDRFVILVLISCSVNSDHIFLTIVDIVLL